MIKGISHSYLHHRLLQMKQILIFPFIISSLLIFPLPIKAEDEPKTGDEECNLPNLAYSNPTCEQLRAWVNLAGEVCPEKLAAILRKKNPSGVAGFTVCVQNSPCVIIVESLGGHSSDTPKGKCEIEHEQFHAARMDCSQPSPGFNPCEEKQAFLAQKVCLSGKKNDCKTEFEDPADIKACEDDIQDEINKVLNEYAAMIDECNDKPQPVPTIVPTPTPEVTPDDPKNN